LSPPPAPPTRLAIPPSSSRFENSILNGLAASRPHQFSSALAVRVNDHLVLCCRQQASEMPADLMLQEATGQNGQYLIYARAFCDRKSNVPKHSMDARRNGRPASRMRAVWGALNGRFVVAIIGVGGAMGAALIPTYLATNHGSTAAPSSASARGDSPRFGDVPRPLAAPPPGGVLPPASGTTFRSREHVRCRRGFTYRPGATYLQHLAAQQSSPHRRHVTDSAGFACRPCPPHHPTTTDGPGVESHVPSA
jgi:hypothetical protein